MSNSKNLRTGQAETVDTVLPAGTLFVYGLQHVLVLYAGAIAVPILIGGAAGFSTEQTAFLISADLFCCGIVSMIQSGGLWKFGVKLPIMMGCTFAAVPTMIVMVKTPEIGMTGLFGCIIAAGVVTIFLAPLVGKMMAFFPPVVVGTVIMATGLNLIPVGVNWVAGRGDQAGDPVNLAISAFVLAVIILITKYSRGFVKNIAVLLGIVAGFVLAAGLGKIDFSKVGGRPMFELIMPFHFGLPEFHLIPILSLVVIMIVVMVETVGMMLAVGEMVDKRLTSRDITRGVRVDGLGTVIGGIFNTFPYVSFSQNVGLVGVTGIRSRWVCVAGGLIMVAMGLMPWLSIIFALIPLSVLGGAGIIMFGMVVAAGIEMLFQLDAPKGSVEARNNLFVIAISTVIGLMPIMSDKVFSQAPQWLSPFTHSGIVLAAITAVLVNLALNGRTPRLAAAH